MSGLFKTKAIIKKAGVELEGYFVAESCSFIATEWRGTKLYYTIFIEGEFYLVQEHWKPNNTVVHVPTGCKLQSAYKVNWFLLTLIEDE